MAAPTLPSLRDRAKQRADMAGAAFVTDDEWNNYLNLGGGELHDIIIDADETAIVKNATIVVTSNVDTYNLPNDFYKVSSFFEQTSSGQLLDLDRMSAHDLTNFYVYEYPINTRGRSIYRYYIAGLSVQYRPTPTGSSNFLLRYIPQYSRMTDDLSTIDYPAVNGWDEYVVLSAVIKAWMKEGSDVSAFMAEQRQREGRIRSMAQKKDNFSPRRIRDVYGGTRMNYRHYLPQR